MLDDDDDACEQAVATLLEMIRTKGGNQASSRRCIEYLEKVSSSRRSSATDSPQERTRKQSPLPTSKYTGVTKDELNERSDITKNVHTVCVNPLKYHQMSKACTLLGIIDN